MQHRQSTLVPHGLSLYAGDLSRSLIRILLEPGPAVDSATRLRCARVLCCSTSYTSILMTPWTSSPTWTPGGRRRWPSSICSGCWNDTGSTRPSMPRKRSRTSPPTAPIPSMPSSRLPAHMVSVQPYAARARHFTCAESRCLMILHFQIGHRQRGRPQRSSRKASSHR